MEKGKWKKRTLKEGAVLNHHLRTRKSRKREIKKIITFSVIGETVIRGEKRGRTNRIGVTISKEEGAHRRKWGRGR